jgi:RHS repeat-associated protein
MQISSTGTVEENCVSLPFGDNLNCFGTDANTQHFTDKERDAESGNDYFGARYYGSNVAGRFMTPDPSGLYFAKGLRKQSSQSG